MSKHSVRVKYRRMRDEGQDPVDVLRAAQNVGMEPMEQIRTVRVLYGLSLNEAKETVLRAKYGDRLDEFYEEQARELEAYSDDHPDEGSDS